MKAKLVIKRNKITNILSYYVHLPGNKNPLYYSSVEHMSNTSMKRETIRVLHDRKIVFSTSEFPSSLGMTTFVDTYEGKAK